MRLRFIRVGLSAAILLGIVSAAMAADSAQPAVKKSRASICHERGTPGYEQTVHYRAFNSIEACLKSGGRLPKNSSNSGANFDASKPVRVGDEGAFYGPLVRVKDGDTLVVKIQGVEVDFRLSGIDAPELDQPYGPEARDELAAIVGSQQCVLAPVDHDMYGRVVAYLWIGDTNVNEEMIRRGMGWFDSVYAKDSFLFHLENEARDAKRGLWVLSPGERVEPWIWRKEQR